MKTYKFEKPKHTFYFDYVIQDGECYVIFETMDSRVIKKLVCKTKKSSCEDLYEKENFVYIII